MTNPLTSLDELIWQQFEKVTVAANKRLGWNKYDLARIADSTAAMFFSGVGVYHTLRGVHDSSVTSSIRLGGGILITSLGYLIYNSKKQKNKRWEEEEIKEIIETGAVKQPKMYMHRPVMLTWPGYFIYRSIDHLTHRNSKISEGSFSLSTIQYNTLAGFTLLSMGLYFLSDLSADYFRSQLMTPPSTKKSIWKAVTDYVTKPSYKAAPQPVESGVKYQTIDDYISH